MDPHAISDATASGGLDFSFFALFLRADPIVKVVMGGLVLASIWSWAIIFDKSMRLGRIRGLAHRFEESFWSGKPLDELFRKVEAKPDHPMALVFVAPRCANAPQPREARRRPRERLRPFAPHIETGHERLDLARGAEPPEEPQLPLDARVRRRARRPLRTVWGIMNAFPAHRRHAVDEPRAVVAPRSRKRCSRPHLASWPPCRRIFLQPLRERINDYATRLDGFSDEFSAILSRQIEERGH